MMKATLILCSMNCPISPLNYKGDSITELSGASRYLGQIWMKVSKAGALFTAELCFLKCFDFIHIVFWNVSKSSMLLVLLPFLPYQNQQKMSWQNMEANFTSCGKRQLAARSSYDADPVMHKNEQINQWDYNYNHKELHVKVCTNKKNIF